MNWDHLSKSWRVSLVLAITAVFLVTLGTVQTLNAHVGNNAHDGQLDHKYIDVDKEDYLTESANIGDDTKKIRQILSPLSGVPDIITPDNTLRVEVKTSAELNNPTASLKPSFGNARPNISLELKTNEGKSSSEIWPDRNVTVLTFTVPAFNKNFKPDLYDLHLSWTDADGNEKSDFQPRAVDVKESIPSNPKVVVVGDPQAGDPRGLTKTFGEAKDNFEDVDCLREGGKCISAMISTLEDLVDNWDETLGDLSRENRWGSWQKAIVEINAMNPDFVIFPGDMALGAKYSIELTDAYRLLNQFQVPTYVTPGNHDGITFHFNEQDGGLNRWERTFSPLHYSKNLGENDRIHIVSLNTFDWPVGKRKRANIICDATNGGDKWYQPCEGYPAIGGYMSKEQLDWVTNDLDEWRREHPENELNFGGFGQDETKDQMLITFSHHDPSWKHGNHAWTSICQENDDKIDCQKTKNGQLGIRDKLRKALMDEKVDVHFAGHVHQDRVARGFEHDGTKGLEIVSAGKGGLRAYDEDGSNLSLPDQSIEDTIQDPKAGPLFVETTTTGSSTSQYWGWRLTKLNHEKTGFTPTDNPNDRTAPADATKFGYEATRRFLRNHPVGDGWEYRLADLGLYSFPSYQFNYDRTYADDGTAATLEFDNDLSENVNGKTLQTLGGCGDVEVKNGDLVWSRTNSGHQDVLVSHTVPAKSRLNLTTNILGDGNCGLPLFGVDSVAEPTGAGFDIHPYW